MMPDKPFTVITYAASASLAAIALIYFFNPNQFIDGESSMSSARTRKKGIVGLSNPANDCFINSILQSLAGLGDLRLYLIRELHRRELDGPAIYAALPEKDANGKPVDGRKLTSLQSGEVTRGLKEMIDNLNERPIYKKTISAGAFIQVLERAFGTRISKSQQDAQELLQIVAERLAEEYHAGREARKRARQFVSTTGVNVEITPRRLSDVEETDTDSTGVAPELGTLELDEPTCSEFSKSISMHNFGDEEEGYEGEGFPLEGQTEAQIECQYCHFMPKANPTSFVMLNLMVPQKSPTTLNECFDAHFKLEYIDDYKCDKCRLQHALESFSLKLARAKSEEQRALIQTTIDAINKAIVEDPENPPQDIELPDISLAPKRRIARHVQITTFPRVVVIHLSRSIFSTHNRSTKNTSKVSFPERLPLGSILNRRHYKLLGMVSHRGTHNSGHYESFRRQHVYAPFSNPHVQKSSGPYRAPADTIPSSIASPKLPPKQEKPSSPLHPDDATMNPSPNPGQDEFISTSATSPTHSLTSISLSPSSTRPSSGSVSATTPPKSLVSSDPPPAVVTKPSFTITSSVPPTPSPSSNEKAPDPPLSKEQPRRPSSSSSSKPATPVSLSGSTAIKHTPSTTPTHRPRFQRRSRKSQPHDRWWRISDDKVKECKTADVLAMQKDVYMLFYEMEREEGEGR